MRKRKKKNVFVIVITIILVTVFVGAITVAGIYFVYDGGDIKLNESALRAKGGTVFFDNQNREIDKSLYGSEILIDIDDTQTALYNAFIAVEDKRFFEHKGIDYRRIFGAALKNIKAGKTLEGASTITQQVIKNTHLTMDKTISRKITEMRLALELEKKMDKREILEIYLNKIYFGKNLYGVGAAAKGYFNKGVNELTIAECAMLAAIPKNPGKYSPLSEGDNTLTRDRGRLVLRLMSEQGYISEKEYETACNENPKYEYILAEQPIATGYIKSAESEAAKKLSIKTSDIRKGNYKIYTNLNVKMLESAAEISLSKVYSSKSVGGETANEAIIILNNYDCSVACYYNPKGISADKINRQIGSLMKPIGVYAPAIESGKFYESSIVLDAKKDIFGYSPNNYNDSYYGNVSIRTALIHSLNVPAVEIYSSLNDEYIEEYSKKINMPKNNSDGLARALGGTTDGIGILNTASAYAMLARGGDYKMGCFIRSIESGSGEKMCSTYFPMQKEHIKENNYCGGNCDNNIDFSLKSKANFSNNKIKFVRGDRVLSDGAAFIVTDMLVDTVKKGTARQLSTLPFAIAGKTGTVAYGGNGENSDIWSASYSTENTVVVWQGMEIGTADTALCKQETGGKNPTIIAKRMYEKMYENGTPVDFEMPDSVVRKNLDDYDYNENQKVSLAPDFVGNTAVSGLFIKNKDMPKISNEYKMPTQSDFITMRFDDDIEFIFSGKSRNIEYNFYFENIFGDKDDVEIVEENEHFVIKISKNMSIFGGALVVEYKYKGTNCEPNYMKMYV